LDSENIPRHVAIIMDGNGRWAVERGHMRVYGHRMGADRVREVVETATELGVETLTLFAFSEENWARPNFEVKTLMKLLNTYLNKERGRLKEKNLRLETIGDLKKLPKANQTLLNDVKRELSQNTGMTLVLALSYGAQSEITDACRSIAASVKDGFISVDDIDNDMFSAYLQTSKYPPLDLLIRTSGECRVSNFLLWQLAYAEIVFSPIYWPDFSREQFIEALGEYQSRQRRFGKTAEQLNSEQSSNEPRRSEAGAESSNSLA